MIKQYFQLFFRLFLVLTCLLAGCSSVNDNGAVVRTTAIPGAGQKQNIALLLPMQGPYAGSAQAIRNGFFAAYFHDKQTNPVVANVSVIDTSGQDIHSIYNQAIEKGANFVVGPLTKPEVQSLTNSNISVPTLALNVPEATYAVPGNLYFFSLSPRDEAAQVAQRARADGHHNVIIIAPATSWGQSAATAFSQSWQSGGGNVVGNLAFNPKQDLVKPMASLLHVDKTVITSKGFREAQKNKVPLSQMRRHDFDMVFLVASPQQARLIKPLLNFYFAGSVPVYATSSVYGGKPSPQFDQDMNGIIFGDMPWILDQSGQLSPSLAAIKSHIMTSWPDSYGNYAKLYAMGVDAYYLATGLGRIASSQALNEATGTLYLGPQHQIYRRLTWAQMRNGVPAAL